MKEYWNQIKDECPKAFAELCKDHDTIIQWGEIDYPDTWGIHVNEPKWVLRHLFDFFDARDINGYCYLNIENQWNYRILSPKIYGYRTSSLQFESREASELAYYKHAFELLEKQLSCSE